MNLQRLVSHSSLAATLLTLAAAPALGDTATYRYTSSISTEFRNEVGFPVPIGAPVTVEFTFDPSALDAQPTRDSVADYLFSGGDTRFQVRIGDHLSDPVDQFRVTVFSEASRSTTDQYNFLSFETQGSFIPVNFPGFLEDAEISFFFREAIPPLPTDELFTSPPDPRNFRDSRVSFLKRPAPSTSATLIFGGFLRTPGEIIPEPGSVALAGTLALVGLIRWRH